MSISVSSASQSVAAPVPVSSSSPSAKKSDSAEPKTEQETVAIGSEKTDALTYSKPRTLPADLATMLEESDRKVAAFMDFLRPLLEQQGLSVAKVATGEQKLTVDQGTIDAAKEAVSEDGEFGVRKVSERILSFAKFAIGDDPSKLQKIRDAVESGFSQAKQVMGGALPEISQKTHDTIMAEFARWEKDGIPSGDTVSLAKPETTSDKTAKT